MRHKVNLNTQISVLNTILMRRYLTVSFITLAILFSSCTNGQERHTNTNLPATEFAQKIAELPSAPIIDVRTGEEFAKGHLQNAKNINWNGPDFNQQIAKLDKSNPVFVYCLSGGRSSAAASYMRSEGFREVYELKGGIINWRSANLPEAGKIKISASGLTKPQFSDLINSNKLVLIDFYADWCAPCKEMKPYLDEISKEMAEKVLVISINVDDNQALCEELKIDGIPVLHLYKNKTLAWAYTGFIGKAAVVNQINKH